MDVATEGNGEVSDAEGFRHGEVDSAADMIAGAVTVTGRLVCLYVEVGNMSGAFG